MSRSWLKGVFGALLVAPLAAQAGVDLTTLDKDMVGAHSQVLVLGSVHLNGMSAGFQAASLDPVLDRLAAYKPDVITIEALPGDECDMAARHPARYGADYCADTSAAKTATGLDIPAAIDAVNRTLAAWPDSPAPAQRRHLASLFLAANDRASAYVQWLQLPQTDRHAGDGLDDALVTLLGTIGTRNNEDYQIAARLAARLGLQRVHAVDNHTGDNARIAEADARAFGNAIEQAWRSDRAAVDALEQREKLLELQGAMLALYRDVNRPETLAALAESNVVPTMRSTSPQHYPQIWVAGWETRNLRMVANVREAFREKPGARVLCIVGASHKPWFDDWLGQLQGVDIVDAEQVLK